MEAAERTFEMTRRAWLSLARLLPGILVLVSSALGQPWMASSCLVIAVWADAVAGWCARRAHWSQTPSGIQIEALVDCICFVAAPAAFAMCVCPRPELAIAIAIFVVAGVFRLARFQAEGLIRGGYRGLPVTYNGYIFPGTAVALLHFGGWNAWPVWSVLLLMVAGLMVSTVVVPEF